MPMTFREHLDHASAIVQTWPKWKREILGDKDSDMPMTKDEAVKWLRGSSVREQGLISPGSHHAFRNHFEHRAEAFSAIANLLSSAIIPTPELLEAVEAVCSMAASAIETAERLSPHENFGLASEAVALVRATFKEPNNA